MTFKKSGVIVFTLDDILVDLSDALYTTILCNWPHYSAYFASLGFLSKEQIYNRPVYLFNDWLIKPSFRTEISKERYANIQLRLSKKIINDFYNNNYYSSLKPSSFAYHSILNPAYIENSAVKTIYIIEYYSTSLKNDKKNKEQFVKTFFNNKKIKYLLLPAGTNINEVFRKNNINWNLLVTDSLNLVKDISENEILENREFLVPKYGYNKVPDFLKKLIQGKHGNISSFDPHSNKL